MAKSKPIGVRFDLEKLELIQKEQNLSTSQAVVNFLMGSYGEIRQIKDVFDTDNAVYKNFYKKPANKLKNGNTEPPAGLTGINLAIWKSENWK